MDFPETVKLEAKRRAHYQCVICRRPMFLHVHHIKPQEEDGPADLDNAAPLCVECHDLYGNDATRRKWIREARDFWWEHCATQALPAATEATLQRLDNVQTELGALRQDQARYGELLGEIKATLSGQYRTAAEAVSLAETVQEVVEASLTIPWESVGPRRIGMGVRRRITQHPSSGSSDP